MSALCPYGMPPSGDEQHQHIRIMSALCPYGMPPLWGMNNMSIFGSCPLYALHHARIASSYNPLSAGIKAREGRRCKYLQFRVVRNFIKLSVEISIYWSALSIYWGFPKYITNHLQCPTSTCRQPMLLMSFHFLAEFLPYPFTKVIYTIDISL